MALTEKQIYDLNNMNKAAQNVQLGTILSELVGDSEDEGENEVQPQSLNNTVTTQSTRSKKTTTSEVTDEVTE